MFFFEQGSDPERFAQVVADVVEALRWDARISSVRQLSERAGMTHTYLNLRLAKKKPFDVEDLVKLANVFQIGPDDIIDRAVEVMAAEREASASEAVESNLPTPIKRAARKQPKPRPGE